MSLVGGGFTKVSLLSAGGVKYNASYVVPNGFIGVYNVTYYGNDTSGNVNSSIVSNFSATEASPPNVTSVLPVNDSRFNVSFRFEVAEIGRAHV